MEAYYENMRRKHHENMLSSLAKMGLSAGTTGGIVGGATSLLGGARSLGGIAKGALGGAALAAPLAVGATGLGNLLMGAPDEGDSSAYARRAGLGGLIGGGLAGAAIGGLVGRRGIGAISKLPYAERVSEKLPLDNVIVDKIKQWAANPSAISSAKSAALLGSVLGGGAGFYAGDEGTQLDFLRNQQRRGDYNE